MPTERTWLGIAPLFLLMVASPAAAEPCHIAFSGRDLIVTGAHAAATPPRLCVVREGRRGCTRVSVSPGGVVLARLAKPGMALVWLSQAGRFACITTIPAAPPAENAIIKQGLTLLAGLLIAFLPIGMNSWTRSRRESFQWFEEYAARLQKYGEGQDADPFPAPLPHIWPRSLQSRLERARREARELLYARHSIAALRSDERRSLAKNITDAVLSSASISRA